MASTCLPILARMPPLLYNATTSLGLISSAFSYQDNASSYWPKSSSFLAFLITSDNLLIERSSIESEILVFSMCVLHIPNIKQTTITKT